MLRGEIRVVDGRQAAGTVVWTEWAPRRREDRRLRLEAAGRERLRVRMLGVHRAPGLPSVSGGARAGILDAGKASGRGEVVTLVTYNGVHVIVAQSPRNGHSRTLSATHRDFTR